MSDINRASGRRVGWYSGVWCCMVKQGVVYCGVNVLWYGMVQASMVWFGMVRRVGRRCPPGYMRAASHPVCQLVCYGEKINTFSNWTNISQRAAKGSDS